MVYIYAATFLAQLANRMIFTRLGVLFLLLCISVSLVHIQAQVPLVLPNAQAVENFNSLTAAAPAGPNIFINGPWQGVNNGSSNVGGLYNLGTTVVDPDRSLGAKASLTSGFISYGVLFVNNTGQSISCIDISFTSKQWSVGSRTNPYSHAFSYQVGPVVPNVSSGIWTNFPALNAVPANNGTGCNPLVIQSTVNGNLPVNQVAVFARLNVFVGIGQQIMLRWTDTYTGCNHHHLSIDNLGVTASTTAQPTALMSSNVRCNQFTVNWTASLGATQYAIEVATDAAFTAPVAGFPTAVAAPANTFTTPATLISNQNYFFRIRANGACGPSPFVTNAVQTSTSPTVTVLPTSATICPNDNPVNLTANGATSYTWQPGALVGSSISQSPAVTTVYTVTGSDAAGCTTTATATITVNPTIAINISPLSPRRCRLAPATTLTGTGAIDYSWAPATGLNATNLPVVIANPATTTTYTLTGRNGDNLGCTGTQTVTVTVNPEPTVTSVVQQPLCNAQASGSINLTVSGGSGNYTFRWSDGPTTEDRSNLPFGSYSVDVCDVNVISCCTTLVFTLVQPPALALVIQNTTNVLCNTSATGSIQVQVTGGTPFTGPTYSFNWDNTTQTTSLITNLLAGSYCVTATDFNGCTTSRCTTIFQPTTPLSSRVLLETPVRCNGETNGSITVTGTGGTPLYSYLWSDNQITPTATNLAPGQYCVTVTDQNNCITSICGNVGEPAVLTINVEIQQNITCNGARDGQILIDMAGGTLPYTYNWAHIPGNDNPEDVDSLVENTYIVTVTDGRGCTASRQFGIDEPDLLQIVVADTQDLSCNGIQNGFIDLEITGGVLPYTINWTRDSSPIPNTTEDLFNLGPGNYSIAIRDAQNCLAQATIPVLQPQALILVQRYLNNVTCNGRNDGDVGYDTEGGVNPISFLWSNGSSIEDQTNLFAGTYCVTATDSNGCTASDCAVILEPTPVVVVATSVVNASCNGSANGSISVEASGGTGPYNYSWDHTAFGANLSELAPDRYCVVASDLNECIARICVDIVVPNPVVVNLVSQTGNGCVGETNGALDISITGGTPFRANPFYTYRWERDGQLYSTFEDITLLEAGVYCVTATDENGCIGVRCFAIVDPAPLQVSVLSQTNPTCNGGNNGSISLQITGGTPNYTVVWTPATGSSGPNLTGLPAGNYSAVITDANGCFTTVSVQLTQPSAVQVQLAQTVNVSCFNLSDGLLRVLASGGNGPYTYQWSRSLLDRTDTLRNVAPGIYSVTVTDNVGCTATLGNLPITQPASPITLVRTKVDIRCNGQANGSLRYVVTGGTAPYTLVWSNGIINIDQITGLAPGTYCLTVTDMNGCTEDQCEEFIAPPALQVTAFDQTTPVCTGQSTGTITLDVSGGVPPYVYMWSNGAASRDLTGLNSGNYSVTVTDRNNCRRSASFTLVEPQQLAVSIANTTNISCAGGSNGAINLTVSGGTGSYRYLWSSGQNVGSISGLTPGTYTVTVTDVNNCTATATTTLIQLPTLTLTTTEVQGTSCGNNGNGLIRTQVAGGTPPYNFQWSHNASLNSNVANNLTPGCYTVTVTDVNACTALVTECIAATPGIVINTLVATDVTCNGTADGVIEIEILGGTAPYNITWLQGVGSGTRLTGLSGGVYSAFVIDARGCFLLSNPIEIIEPFVFEDSQNSVTPPTCNGQSNGNLLVRVTGGTLPYIYRWSNGTTQQQLDQIPAGTYCVTTTDARGCQFSNCLVLPEPAPITFTLGLVVNDDCVNSGSGAIDLSVVGGDGTYSFSWNTGENSEDLSNLTAGTYCLSIIDESNCRADTCIIIGTNLGPSVVFDPLFPTTFCTGETPVPLMATPIGGTFSGTGVVNNQFDPTTVGPGSYRIFYTGDEFGCDYRDSINVNVSPSPDSAQIRIGFLPTIPAFCSNTNVMYLTFFTPIQSGVQGVITGPGIIRIGNSYRFNPSLAGPGSHPIKLALTNPTTGCQTVITQTVVVGSPITVGMTTSQATICAGDETTLTAFGATSYSWAPNSGLSCNPFCSNVGNTVTAKPGLTTTYTVTGTQGGCIATASVQVIVRPVVPIRIQASAQQICQGVEVVLNATSNATNYTYVWDDGTNTFAGPTLLTQPEITTSYSLTGLDPNGCIARATQIIRVTPTLVLASASPAIICKGSSSVLNASSSQPGLFNFIWTPTTGLNKSFGGSVIATPQKTTTYTVFRNGSGSCRTATVTVTVIDNAAVINLPNSSFCELGACVGLNGTPAGGVWAAAAGVVGNSFCPQLAGPGTYTLRYSGAIAGCSFEQTREIMVTAAPAARIGNFIREFCRIGNPYTFTLSAPGATLSGAPIQSDGRTLNPMSVPAGIYPITVTAPVGNGCFRDTVYEVSIREPVVSISGLDQVYCGNAAPVVLTGLPAGGTFKINSEAPAGSLIGNTLFPSVTKGGTIYITYYGVDGPCNYSTTVPVVISKPIAVTPLLTHPSCTGCPNGIIALGVTGGTAPFTYTISNVTNVPPNSPVFTGLLPGTYNMTVTDANNCQQVLAVTLTANDNGDAFCNAPTNISVDITNSGDVVVTWQAVGNASGYEVEYAELPNINPQVRSTPTNSITLSGLRPRTNYTLVVRTLCTNDRVSPNSATIPVFTDLVNEDCETPTITGNLVVNNTIQIFWNQVSGVTGYEIAWRLTGSQNFSFAIVGQNATTHLITGLMPFRDYDVQIRSLCGNEESDFSPVQVIKTGVSAVSCDVPVITQIVPGVTRTMVFWNSVIGADRYVLAWRHKVIGAPWITVSINSATATDFELSNLLLGSTYEIRIRSRCGTTQSSWSNVREFTTLTAKEEALLAVSEAVFSVYPNPSRGQINVRISDDGPVLTGVSVLNLQGQMVFEAQSNWGSSAEQSFELLGLASGVYVLKLNFDDGSSGQARIILQ